MLRAVFPTLLVVPFLSLSPQEGNQPIQVGEVLALASGHALQRHAAAGHAPAPGRPQADQVGLIWVRLLEVLSSETQQRMENGTNSLFSEFVVVLGCERRSVLASVGYPLIPQLPHKGHPPPIRLYGRCLDGPRLATVDRIQDVSIRLMKDLL